MVASAEVPRNLAEAESFAISRALQSRAPNSRMSSFAAQQRKTFTDGLPLPPPEPAP
jgi:hypothetical protein